MSKNVPENPKLKVVWNGRAKVWKALQGPFGLPTKPPDRGRAIPGRYLQFRWLRRSSNQLHFGWNHLENDQKCAKMHPKSWKIKFSQMVGGRSGNLCKVTLDIPKPPDRFRRISCRHRQFRWLRRSSNQLHFGWNHLELSILGFRAHFSDLRRLSRSDLKWNHVVWMGANPTTMTFDVLILLVKRLPRWLVSTP